MKGNRNFEKERKMAQVTDQVAAYNKAQLEAALKMAEAAAGHMEKLAEVQFQAAKAAYANSVSALRQLTAVKDVSELARLTTGMAQPALAQASEYAKSLYDVVASAHAQFAVNLEKQVAEMNKNMMTALDAAMKSAPPGSEPALAAAKSALQSTNAVYETMVKAAKQMASLAEANSSAASHSASGKKKKG
jgi:phasin family protein